MTYAFSLLAMRATSKGGETRHCVGMLEAVSPHEAEGLALAIGRKVYPVSDGWGRHHAMVCPSDQIVTLETAELA